MNKVVIGVVMLLAFPAIALWALGALLTDVSLGTKYVAVLGLYGMYLSPKVFDVK